MSAHYAAWVRIGGRIKRSKIEQLLKAIREASVSLEWGDAPFAPQSDDELLTVRRDGHLWFCDDQARWGEFPELEGACRKLKLGYSRHTEGACDCDAERVDFRPGMKEPLVRIGSNVNSNVTYVPTEAVRKALALLEGDQSEKALRVLRKLCPDVSELPAFEIV